MTTVDVLPGESVVDIAVSSFDLAGSLLMLLRS
jgi:hypothetical protein